MAFDVNKYLVTDSIKEVEILIDDEKINVKIKELPWALKNRFISQALSWDTNGQTHFDGDLYIRESLKYMIVEAPWGQTNDMFLIRVGNNSLGAALEALVPKAFPQGGKSLTEVKKE